MKLRTNQDHTHRQENIVNNCFSYRSPENQNMFITQNCHKIYLKFLQEMMPNVLPKVGICAVLNDFTSNPTPCSGKSTLIIQIMWVFHCFDANFRSKCHCSLRDIQCCPFSLVPVGHNNTDLILWGLSLHQRYLLSNLPRTQWICSRNEDWKAARRSEIHAPPVRCNQSSFFRNQEIFILSEEINGSDKTSGAWSRV